MRLALLTGDAGTDGGPATATLAVPSELPAAEGVALALGVSPEADPATVLLRVIEHRVVRGPAALGLDPTFQNAAATADQFVDGLITAARQRQSEGRLQDARQLYERARVVAQGLSRDREADVLVAHAQLEKELGEVERVRALLDRALARQPDHERALQARAAMARESGESANAAALLERVVPKLQTTPGRIRVLCTIADESLTTAQNALAIATELSGDAHDLLVRLRAVHEAAGKWDAALTAAVKAAEATHDRSHRARALADAARLCSERGLATARAVALYEAAIEDDPSVPGAFEAIEAELERAGDLVGLASAYDRQLQRLRRAQALDAERALLHKLASVHTRLGDTHAAMTTLERLVRVAPQDLNARMSLAALLEEVGEPAMATRALEAAALAGNSDASVYHSLARLQTRAQSEDGAYLACSVLVALGEADADEQQTFARHRPVNVSSFRAPLDEDGWSQLLPPRHSALLDEIATLVEPAAVSSWLARPSLVSMPPPRARVDLAKNDVPAARCWLAVAQRLGVPRPELYVDTEELLDGARLLLEPAPTVLLGRRVLEEQSPAEMSFLATHHLSYTRPGWRIVGLLSSAHEIRSLLLAGLAAAEPRVSSEFGLGQHEKKISTALSDALDPRAREALAHASKAVLSDPDALDVGAWIRSVEETACRAALLVSGDVTVARTVLALAGATPADVSAAERARALHPFCVSQRHLALRHWLGISVE